MAINGRQSCELLWLYIHIIILARDCFNFVFCPPDVDNQAVIFFPLSGTLPISCLPFGSYRLQLISEAVTKYIFIINTCACTGKPKEQFPSVQ